MNLIWLIIPPWLFAVVITFVGRWGDRYFTRQGDSDTGPKGWVSFTNTLMTCLLFLAMLPVAVLSLFGPLLPFAGAQSGLALAIAIVLFGLVPARLLESGKTGFDYAFWALLIDFLRVGGSLTMIGWLLNR